jgi:glucose/mannose-6-phosphate isomerase
MSDREDAMDTELFKQTVGFPEQIESALEIELPEIPPAAKICICGMGTSALAGEILADYTNNRSKTQLHVVRRTDFPKWVDEETCVILISYSGNTRETLLAYDEAVRRKSKIICMTSGGELQTKCIGRKDTLVLLPGGMQSRVALGLMLGALASVLERMGISETQIELERIVPILKNERDAMLENQCLIARLIAVKLVDKIPVIYGLANMKSSALRWKNQINENSKNISFSGSIPEFNHNEIVGWTDDSTNNKNFIPVILYDDNASKMVKSMTDTSIGILSDKKLSIITNHVEGSSNLEKNLKCIILGDVVSIFLADLSGTDPVTDQPLREVRDRADLSV